MEDQQPTTDKILDYSGKILDIPYKNEKILDRLKIQNQRALEDNPNQ